MEIHGRDSLLNNEHLQQLMKIVIKRIKTIKL